jgi:hypothetical protein
MIFKKDRRFFEGWFCQGTGKLTGKCRMIDVATMSVYEGEISNDIIHGKGYQKWIQDGSEYIGDYYAGKREGYGIFKYPNGDQYEGEWMDNKPDGMGTYTWAESGASTEGMW